MTMQNVAAQQQYCKCAVPLYFRPAVMADSYIRLKGTEVRNNWAWMSFSLAFMTEEEKNAN